MIQYLGKTWRKHEHRKSEVASIQQNCGMFAASLHYGPDGSSSLFSRDHVKPETIEATAMGTSTQMGANFGVSLEIYEFSTPEDRQMLVQAFEKGQNQGLVNALSKKRAVGHCSITGTIGYDVAYIRMIPTPTGRKIRFVTNRLLRFGEVYWDTQSTAYNLTAGEFDLNDQDKKKTTASKITALVLGWVEGWVIEAGLLHL